MSISHTTAASQPSSLSNSMFRLAIILAATLTMLAGGISVAHATTLYVNSCDQLQPTINSAVYGDTIIINAALSCTAPGPIILPYKGAGTGTDADYITIQSSALANLPVDRRVGPTDAANLPKIITQNYNGFTYGPPAVQTQASAHHYKLIGLEITATSTAGLSQNDLITLGDGSSAQTSLTQVPHHITIDRCYIHVGSSQPAKRGIALNSGETSILNSYIAGFKLVGEDSQAICMWNGPGPYHIINNYLEAAAENILVLGSANSIPNLIPSDVEIRRNLFTKPLSWRPGDPSYAGTAWTVKNLLELKTGKRVSIDGNIFEYCWQSGQDGNAIGFAPIGNSNGPGSTPQLEDITFTNNIVRHAAGGIALCGKLQPGDTSHLWRATIRNNLFTDIDGVWGDTYGQLFLVYNMTDGVSIEHNTGFNTSNAVGAPAGGNTNFASRNNVFRHDVMNGLNTPGDAPLDASFPSAIWMKNVQIAGGPASYYAETNHTPNYFPTNESQVGFVNYAGGDYHLASTSPYKNAGSDGKDIGADIDALNAATGGVMSGLSPTPYGGMPATVPGTLQVENFDNGGEGVAYHDQDSGNNGGVYRTTDVDIRAMTGTSNGYDVFSARAGEWLKYTITVPTSGAYDIKASVASRLAGGAFHFEVDNVDMTGSITAPTTGAWSVFQAAGKSGVNLTAGTHVLRLALDTNGVEGIVADFDAITISQSSQGFSDDFNDNSRDATKWNVSELYSGYANDPQVTVLEQNQQLEITPISSTAGHHHNGYVSATTWNMTGAQARVEVKRVAKYSASTVFYIGSDSNNGYLIIEEDGQMFFKTKIAGVENYPTPIPYDSVQHHFWRFRHDPATDQIKFETSADGVTWTVQRSVQRQVTITALRVELDAGTYAAEWNMGSSIFDNFQLITP